jgi:anti-sigma regulatory factor (Ser/Thr protein kinase)
VFIPVADPSQVAEARRLVVGLADRAGLPTSRVDAVAIVVTELATNLLKHGGGGHIHADCCDDFQGAALQLLALDRGRGMSDPGRCMQDGYSTAGSAGTGLGAVKRLSDAMHVYSRPGQGCAVMACFMLTREPTGRMLTGAVLAPYPGELVCGDGWAWRGQTIVLVDGLGHGIEAARAAETATRAFLSNATDSCEQIVQRLHRALAPTRGAAVAVVRIDAAAHSVGFVGVGNISAAVIDRGRVQHMISHNGTAGHVAPRIREFRYGFPDDALVIMHSDGVGSHWDIAGYPGLIAQHPAMIAGLLLRDHRRERDDAAVVVARIAR